MPKRAVYPHAHDFPNPAPFQHPQITPSAGCICMRMCVCSWAHPAVAGSIPVCKRRLHRAVALLFMQASLINSYAYAVNKFTIGFRSPDESVFVHVELVHKHNQDYGDTAFEALVCRYIQLKPKHVRAHANSAEMENVVLMHTTCLTHTTLIHQ